MDINFKDKWWNVVHEIITEVPYYLFFDSWLCLKLKFEIVDNLGHVVCGREWRRVKTASLGLRDSLLWWEGAKQPGSSTCLHSYVLCNSHLIRNRTEVEHNHNCFCIQTVDDGLSPNLVSMYEECPGKMNILVLFHSEKSGFVFTCCSYRTVSTATLLGTIGYYFIWTSSEATKPCYATLGSTGSTL